MSSFIFNRMYRKKYLRTKKLLFFGILNVILFQMLEAEAGTEKLVTLSVKNILTRNQTTTEKFNEVLDSNPSSSKKTFVSLSAECDNDTYVLHLHTSEPFNGWFYARDHQMTCSQRGSGQTVTTMVIDPGQDCGVKKILKKHDEEGKLKRQLRKQDKSTESEIIDEIALYVQHDEFVQQVIDEQFLVHCKQDEPHGVVSYQDDNPLSKTIDQIVTKSISTLPVKEEMVERENVELDKLSKSEVKNQQKEDSTFLPRIGVAVAEINVKTGSKTVDKNEDDDDKDTIEVDVGSNNVLKMGQENEEVAGWKPVAVIRHRDMVDFRSHPVSGWMELTSALTAEVIEDKPVSVGKLVNLVIRLRQSKDRDTMISNCAVHGERGTEEEERQRRRGERGFYQQNQDESPTQDLTDYRGCSLNSNVMPNFAAAFNSLTGVKKLSTVFPIFKFPARSKLTFRCSVLVCRKNCPVAKCDNDNGDISTPQQEFLNVKILEKFMLETSVEVAERGTLTEDALEEDKGFSIRNVRLLESAIRPDLDAAHSASDLFHQSSALQVEEESKFNEVSRKVNQVEQIEIPPEKNDENSSVLLEEDQLCLSPSRLVLGFGILLVILLLALVASCMMWMRARSYSRRPKPTAILTPPPTQRVQMSPSGVATRVATPIGTTTTTTAAAIVSTRPYFVAPRYIRVMH